MNVNEWQWIILIGLSLALFFFAPYAKNTNQFFKARIAKRSPGVLALTGSLVISWIFAKSITNAANLGMEFGIVGGVAYAGYYLSFLVAGWIIYRLRTIGGFASIHHFLNTRFGKQACWVFSLLIAIRLFNEVWSNTMVIGSYFGSVGDTAYYLAIILFTVLTLAYALKGGLSSSIFTDLIQMVLFAVLLLVLLAAIFGPDTSYGMGEALQSGSWTMSTGINLMLAAILQSLSYPFHDPVLTDRGFISSPRVTLKAFLWATVIGFICIVLFSLVGVYARFEGMQGQAAVQVGQAFGVVVLLIVNIIMITSAASTLDSTFASFSKLIALDLGLGNRVSLGRASMVALAILGSIPVFLDASILSATTISGTMVIGLCPVFICWRSKPPKSSFYLSIGCGLLFGFALVLNWFPERLILSKGAYAPLLWINLWGLLSCFIVYLIPLWLKRI
ncbi:sodium:solute symporter family transporter [Robiginitalea sp. IMCC43444]|uniref:sodium:solute symporter family transporter n=1 Tax=Robiginitalea sp. IMCC43444 TaxID=3459121 RepID=UPI0040437FAB